jgi:glycosyltransferase involved in cell wall biosynthesis
LARKFAALDQRFAVRVLATAADGKAYDDGRFHLVARAPRLDGPLFWLRLPGRLRRIVAEFKPAVIVTQSPYEAAFAAIARTGVPVIVELHGDWRTATRLYGSPARRVLAPVADRFAAFGLRRAAGVRTVSAYTSGLLRELGVEPAAEFAAFMDLELFLDRPPAPHPAEPRALFVGVLELYKNLDGLAEVWRRVARAVPTATLRIVGRGSQREIVEQLVAESDGRVVWDERLTQAEVARALDAATCLVLPSRSEGMGRVLIEAFARARPVVAMRVGGIRDVVTDDVSGLLRGNDGELAEALSAVLSDAQLAQRLADGAHAAIGGWIASPEEFADRLFDLVKPYTGDV